MLRFFSIAITRSFMPINILFLMFFIGDSKEVSTFSFFIAASQILSNVDFGINALLLSSKSTGNNCKIKGCHSEYFVKFFKYKLMLIIVLLIMSALFKIEVEDLFYTIIISLVCGECLILYNLVCNSSISESNYRDISYFILMILFFEFVLFFCVYLFNDELFYKNLNLSFSASMLLSTLFVYFLILKAPVRPERPAAFSLNKVLPFKLQVSQISSSLILNKDYILLYFLGSSDIAVLYSTVARLMLIPLQINSVVISKFWVDIANNGVIKKIFRHQLVKLFVIVLIASVIPFLISLSFNGLDVLFLLIILVLFNLANSFSGLSSAYATVSIISIPSVVWYLITLFFVFFLSIVFYLLDLWYCSLVVSLIYFIFLGFRNIRDIRWK